MENSFHRTLRNAGFAVDAFVRMNIEHLFPLVEALDRAYDYTVGVLASETGFGNDMCHGVNLLARWIGLGSPL